MHKLAIIGYGQMGKMIEIIAPDFGFDVIARIDPLLNTNLNSSNLSEADLAVEFTTPQTAADNILECLNRGIRIVSGSTGWYDKLPQITKKVQETQGSFLYGSNFSLGMNLFYRVLAKTAEIMSSIEEYDVYGYELHHRHKKDSPSGTAKELSDIILQKYTGRKDKAVYECLHTQKKDNELHFASIRAGEIPGEHRIGFDSSYDTIELKHTARSRKGLAAGALKAARFILHHQGIYRFRDILRDL